MSQGNVGGNASNECFSTELLTGKRRSSFGAFADAHSAKKRRISLASVDISRELQLRTVLEQRKETAADRFIPSRPKFASPFNTTPRTNRFARKMGLADERILNFSDFSSSIAAPKIHSLFRINALQLFRSPVQTQTMSATSNIGRHRHADLILDGPNISPDPLAYSLSWSTKNYIAVAFGPTVYYQNLDTRVTKRLWSINEDRWEEVHALQWGGSAIPYTIALGTTVGRVSLCDAKIDMQTMTWPKDSLGSVGGIDWADHIFAVGRRSGKISLFDSRVKEGVRTLVGHKAKVFGVRWSHDGRYLASGDQGGAVYIWDARADKFLVGGGEKSRKMKHKGPVKALAWCPWKPDLLATGSIFPEGMIRIWSATSTISPPSPIHTIALNTSVTSLHWSPHCQELLSTHGSTWSDALPTGRLKPVDSPLANSITVHAYPSCKRLVSVPAHLGTISHSCLSPDGTSVFSLSAWDESMKMWKVWGKREDAGRRESTFDRFAIR